MGACQVVPGFFKTLRGGQTISGVFDSHPSPPSVSSFIGWYYGLEEGDSFPGKWRFSNSPPTILSQSTLSIRFNSEPFREMFLTIETTCRRFRC